MSMAFPILWSRQPDNFGVLALAINACAERDGYPEQLGRIAELLEAVRALWLTLPELDDERERFETVRLAFRLLHIADIEAVTAP